MSSCEEKASHGFGSMVGGAPPCANCETEPARNIETPDEICSDQFCSVECFDEYHGRGEYAE